MESIIQEEFDCRQEDIDLIIDLIMELQKGDFIKSNIDNDRLVNTLSSVISLMTYNQIESTMRGCLESLYDDINDKKIPYDQLKNDIQLEVFNGILKKFTTGKGLHSAVGTNFHLMAPIISLNIRSIFNGNIDTKKIHAIKEKYAVNVDADIAYRNGMDITSFKDARNDLAHGNISFSAYGNRNPYTEVIDKSNRTSGYMKAIISAFDLYISNQDYKS